MFSAFKKFYLLLKFRFTTRFVVKDITFGPRSRYRKIPPAAVANQIAARLGFRPLTNKKNSLFYCFYEHQLRLQNL